jgi:hypothetical protein
MASKTEFKTLVHFVQMSRDNGGATQRMFCTATEFEALDDVYSFDRLTDGGFRLGHPSGEWCVEVRVS